MSMISNPVITGGVFSQNIDQRQFTQTQTIIQIQKSAMDRLQEAAAHTAFHNSGERFDPSKCHPNTRVAVLDKIEKWALRTDPETSNASILWLCGAAGAGKSAIAQTVAERFHSKGLLLASFFFGRSDATRNHARSLVATIVYQLYYLLPPTAQSRVLAVIDQDPLIFTKSLLAQFETLIVNPLQSVFDNGLWTSASAPRLVIIDGLDECLNREMQRNILLVLSASVRQFHSPLLFLLASRPEHDIQTMFSSPDFLPIHTRLFLDETYLPDHDIELFLRDQFEECRTTHPFRQTIPTGWPSNRAVKEITNKSSGQFIYASVVAKYVKSTRHRPHHRLDVVLNLRPAMRDLPFSELDSLYTHIFSGVDDIKRVLDVISFAIIFRNESVFVKEIEHILRLDAGEIPILLCDLGSVISYEKNGTLKILHASLVDYLLDGTRSKEYSIDVIKRRAEYVVDCFQYLSYVEFQDHSEHTVFMTMSYFEHNHHSLGLTESLYNAIRGFSILRIYHSVFNMGLQCDQNPLLQSITFIFMLALLKFLKKSDSLKCLELYQHHQAEYDFFLRESMKACSPEAPAPLVFALVAIYSEFSNIKLSECSRYAQYRLFHKSHFEHRALATFQLDMIETDLRYVEYLSNFLRDPKRSREFYAGPKLFAQAAKYCLLYLCDHRAFAQKIPPRMSAQQRMRRKHTPWKWHRRVLREDIRGSCDTPWLWLRRSTSFGTFSRTLVLHRKANDLVYIHSPRARILLDPAEDEDDPVVIYRLNTEKYYLALTYLNYFLPRAAKLDDLARMCQRLTFASRSQDFPRESARARYHMQAHVAQSE
ncbi:hypothetical protein D9619_007090 [Psilocybe cf. subviscida]|uniref:Nephrocystin 3-like N-terminal domain-containing protein n=1 Tax=Psilocybe cf. subviscida TaxID=2480587 RepID=A0A8H5EWU1_9AGAR|nr:hypothetical protein D9619_007090 [Psilocybe cf. subviscida]